jgi:Beta-propeller repeat
MRNSFLIVIKFSTIFLFVMGCASSNPKISDTCGDGIMDGETEECDGEDLGNITCLKLDYYGGILKCNDDCRLDITECADMGRCGDEVIHENDGEQCEDQNLGGESCETLNLGGGVLGCDQECNFDVMGCDSQPVCGDGNLESPVEECENGNLGGESCESLRFHGGNLTCDTDCTFNTSNCETYGMCGDGAVQASYEECDSGSLSGMSCSSLGYHGGSLSCSSDCSFDISDCQLFGECGDGALQSTYEECDSSIVPLVCSDIQGFYEGTLNCTSSCTFDTSSCGYCGDSLVQASNEECDGAYLGGASCLDAEYWYGSLSCNSCSFAISNCENVRLLGTSGDDVTTSLEFSPNGDMFLTGHSAGNYEGASNVGLDDALLIKYNADGSLGWNKLIGSSGADTSFDTAVDSWGNIYVVGRTTGNLNGLVNSGLEDCFIIKYNSSGVAQWTKLLGTTADDICRYVSIHPDGSIIVSGKTGGSFPGWPTNGLTDIFVAKYTSSGTRTWLKQMGTSSDEETLGMALDASGNIFISGWTGGALEGLNHGGNDIFVVKLNTWGIESMILQWGTSANDSAYEIALDSTGNIYVTGSTGGGLDGNILRGENDIFLTKFSSSGISQWTKQWGSTGNDIGWSVSLDTSGNIYTWGISEGSVESVPSNGLYDSVLTKFNNSGTLQWVRQYGTNSDDYGLFMDISSTGAIFLTGWSSGAFDGQNYSGAWDLFIMRVLNP